MKLYARLFLSHLLVICVALCAVLLLSEALAPAFIRHHVEQMVTLIGPDGASLHPNLERIFERFYRVDAARTRADGSGVDLTIARGLANRMGGSLSVKSGPGGSIFTLSLLAAHPH